MAVFRGKLLEPLIDVDSSSCRREILQLVFERVEKDLSVLPLHVLLLLHAHGQLGVAHQLQRQLALPVVQILRIRSGSVVELKHDNKVRITIAVGNS